MLRAARSLFASVLLATVALLPGSSAAAASPGAHAAASSTATQAAVTIDGAVARPLRLTVADLRDGFPQHEQKVTYQTGDGPETRVFRGPLLVDVLNAAGPAFDEAVKNDPLRHAILVKASDGYQAVVSWGEIDPRFGAEPVLLATEQDGVGLDEEGPRLTAPGDQAGGRYVSWVVSVTLVRVGA